MQKANNDNAQYCGKLDTSHSIECKLTPATSTEMLLQFVTL